MGSVLGLFGVFSYFFFEHEKTFRNVFLNLKVHVYFRAEIFDELGSRKCGKSCFFAVPLRDLIFVDHIMLGQTGDHKSFVVMAITEISSNYSRIHFKKVWNHDKNQIYEGYNDIVFVKNNIFSTSSMIWKHFFVSAFTTPIYRIL